MSSAGHLSELESLRSQVADLTRALAERDQSMQAQSHHLEETMQDLREQSHLLRTITEGTAVETGEEFFAGLVTHLTRSLNVQYAIVGEVVGEQTKTVRTLAVSSGGQLVDNFEYGLVQTPCETALERTFACYEWGVQDQFPRFTRLAELGVEGYSGIPLHTKAGLVNGLLVVMDTKPLRNTERLKSLMAVFASRAGAELQRQQAEAAHRESEARLRFTQFAVDHAEDGILWADDSKRFMYANEAACRLLGYSNEELLTLSISDIAPYHDPTRFQQRLDQIKQGTAAIYESIHRRKDGTEFPIEASVTYLEHEGRGYTCGIVRDITERKRIEQERAQALADLHNVIEAIPDIVFVLNTQGNLVKWNRRLEDVTGYSHEELLNKSALSFVPPEEQTRTAAAIQRAFTEGYAELDGRLLTKEQRLISYHWTSALLKNSHCEPIGITGIGQDVSDKKRAEEALRENEQRLALAVEGSTDILWDAQRLPGEPWYAPQTPIWWSPRVREWLGLEESESFETLEQWAGRLHPDDKDRVFGQLAAHIEHRVPYDAEYRLRTNRGDYLWIRGRGQASWDEQGEIRRMSGSCQDITDRKQAEEAIREAELRYRTIFEQAGAGVAQIDSHTGRFVQVNRRYCEIVGLTEAEMLATTFGVITHPDDLQGDLDNMTLLLCGETRSFTMEKRYVRKDGGIMWVNLNVSPLWRPGEKAVHHIAIVEDITDRKRVESKLRLTQFTIDHAVDAVYWINRQAQILDVNEAASLMLGYSKDELCAMTVHDLNPDFQADMWPGFWAETQQRGTMAFETVHRSKTGQLIPVEVSINHLSYEGQELHCAFVRNITERKCAEEALHASEERFDLAVRGSNTGIWDWDLRTNKTYFSPLWKSMLGHEEHELRGELSDWEERLHPDDRERSLATVRAYLDGTTPQYKLEHRLRHKDGSYRWILARGVSISDAEGKPYRMAGSHIDITEQKQTQEALAQSERQLRTVLDALPVGVWFTDQSGKPVLANPAAKQIWLNIKQIGLQIPNNPSSWRETIEPLNEPHRWALSHALTTGASSLNETLDLECLDGTKKTIRNSTVPVQDEAGIILGAIVLNEDITTLRQAQEALKLTQFSVDHAVEGFFWISPDARVMHVNEAACRMLEYTRDELTAMTVHDIDPNFSLEAWPTYWAELKEKGSLTFETKYWSKTGRVLDTEVTVNYLQYEGNEYSCAIMRDIGERKRVQVALRASEERYRSLYDETPTMYFTLATDGTVLSVNRFGAEQLGYQVEELTGHSVLGLFHEDDKETVAASLSECLAIPETTRHWEFRKVRKDGSVIWVRETVHVGQSSSGETIVLVTCEDMTERKRAEEELRKSHAFIRQIIDTDPNFIFAKDREGRFVLVNKAVADVYGTTVDELIGKTDADFNPNQEEVAFFRQKDLAVMDTLHELFLPEEVITDSGGRTRWLQTVKRPILDDEGRATMVLGASTDITERKRMEETLRQRERALRAAIEERERISQDLHDGILQSLFAVGLTLEASKSTMSPSIRKTSGLPLNQAIDQLNRVMHEIRHFIAGLGSDLLQGKDLSMALQHMLALLTQNQATRVRLAVEDRAAKAVSAEQSQHLFLVIQEAVSNCIRHSRAPEARVSLKMLKQGVRLSIRDNGRGFNQDAAKKTGHGLVNMAARAQKIGGRFTVLSKVNEGTRIVLDLPKEASVVYR